MPDREGPTLGRPCPCRSCTGCHYLDVRGDKYRSHGKVTFHCLLKHGERIVPRRHDVMVFTPEWCPLLPKEDENGTE